MTEQKFFRQSKTTHTGGAKPPGLKCQAEKYKYRKSVGIKTEENHTQEGDSAS